MIYLSFCPAMLYLNLLLMAIILSWLALFVDKQNEI